MSYCVVPRCHVPISATVRTGPDWWQEHASWLYCGFVDGSLVDGSGLRFPVTLVGLGDLPLPDGRVIAGDPYLCDAATEPLTERVPEGAHPATVALVGVEPEDLREAALVLITGDAPVVRWSLGQSRAQAVEVPAASLGVGEYTGFAVEMGVGALFSPDARLPSGELVDQDRGIFDDPLSRALDATAPLGLALTAPRTGALPVVACRSGWGDGVYPTWLGHADDGSVVVVMADFLVLDDPFRAPGSVGAHS